MSVIEKLRRNFEAVVFDIGGVLIDYDPVYLFKDFFKCSEEETKLFISKTFDSEWNKRQEIKFTMEEGIEELIKQFPKFREIIPLFNEYWGNMVRGEILGSVKILTEMKKGGLSLYALTNIPGSKLYYLINRFDFMRLFDGIIASGLEGIRKPEKEIFELLLERYDLRNKKVIFIDDNLQNTISATKCGLASIVFVSPEKLIESLNSMC